MEAAAGRLVDDLDAWHFDRTWPSMHTIERAGGSGATEPEALGV
jgi:hypothetical protein